MERENNNWAALEKMVVTEDECLIEERCYECTPKGFQSRNIKQRNNDFYNSQKQENKELEEALDELDNSYIKG